MACNLRAAKLEVSPFVIYSLCSFFFVLTSQAACLAARPEVVCGICKDCPVLKYLLIEGLTIKPVQQGQQRSFPG